MIHRRPPYIPQKRRIYIGCEGTSEAGYAAVLQDLINTAALPIYFKIDELAPGAGDPLARIQLAVRRIEQQSRNRTVFSARFVFLDEDQAERDPQRANNARRIATENNINIIWRGPVLKRCFYGICRTVRHIVRPIVRAP